MHWFKQDSTVLFCFFPAPFKKVHGTSSQSIQYPAGRSPSQEAALALLMQSMLFPPICPTALSPDLHFSTDLLLQCN